MYKNINILIFIQNPSAIYHDKKFHGITNLSNLVMINIISILKIKSDFGEKNGDGSVILDCSFLKRSWYMIFLNDKLPLFFFFCC
jgi:hypothetical protein